MLLELVVEVRVLQRQRKYIHILPYTNTR